MGACFQAPLATPGQRQMEMASWMGFDGLFAAHYKSCSLIVIIIVMSFDTKNN